MASCGCTGSSRHLYRDVPEWIPRGESSTTADYLVTDVDQALVYAQAGQDEGWTSARWMTAPTYHVRTSESDARPPFAQWTTGAEACALFNGASRRSLGSK